MVSWSVSEVMKRIEVTSSTSAAVTIETTSIAGNSRRARWLTASRSRSIRTSKNFLSSRNPMTVIIATRNRMMSRLANSSRCGMSISLRVSNAVVPTKANASRNCQ